MVKKVIFCGITFQNIKDKELKKIFKKKGLFVFPSGPNLSNLKINSPYHIAIKKSDYTFFDSGFFVLLLKIFKGISVKKLSGYKFLNYFFKYISIKNNQNIFCIDPDQKNSIINKKYLNKLGVKKVCSYVSPFYSLSSIKDKKLLKKINKVKPNYIITNIAGGKQEILGYYIKQNINFKTSIYCTGGAISFFTGQQPPVNKLLDYLFLGWFVRILFNPRIFLLRYIGAFRLLFIISKEKIFIN